MRTQTVNNGLETKKFQSYNANPKQKMTNNTSFGMVLIDERGISEGVLCKQVTNFLNYLKKNLEKELGDLAKSTEHDVLIYPFKYAPDFDAITMLVPKIDEIASSYKGVKLLKRQNNTDYDRYFWYFLGTNKNKHTARIQRENIIDKIKQTLPNATTFPAFAEKNKHAVSNSYLWDLNQPLPEDVIKGRFMI